MTGATDFEAIGRAGVAALQRGDAAAARNAFEQVAAAGRASPQLWLLLAQACGQLRDAPGEDRALDQVLSADPRNPYALIMKGDLHAARGDDRAATSFYQLALANVPAGQLPADLIQRLRRAESAVAAASAKFAAHLEAHLVAADLPVAARPDRVQEAIDIATGTKSVFLQQPTSFFYPRLPHIQFYDPATFDWLTAMVAAAPAMRAELEAALAEDAGFEPYVAATPGRPNRGHSLLDDPRWSAFHLWQDGAIVEANARRCPATMAALALAPQPLIASRSPMALFSVLRPHTHIPPHHGLLNTRLICHIPLIVPDNCRLRVGNDVRTVQAGVPLLFDDSIEHEAWNDSDAVRVVLLFEIWRPELSVAEHEALTALFGAIGTYPGE